jgi:2-polyprenyl-6-methoxyphenol hydroxylase-like FAD-dependent oxidoreductase
VEAFFDIIGDSDARENYSASSKAYGGAAVSKLRVRAKLLVGADGIRSNVRKAMRGEAAWYYRCMICCDLSVEIGSLQTRSVTLRQITAFDIADYEGRDKGVGRSLCQTFSQWK